jgi:type I restriction enzyme S subunit
MSKWKKYNLSELADIKLSNVDKKEYPNQRQIRLCNYTDVYKNNFINSKIARDFMISTCSEIEYQRFNLKQGQVAITKDSEKRNDIGISTYISENFEDIVLGYHLALITPNYGKLDGKFLNYWLNSNFAKTYFENNAGGSGQRCTLTIDIIKAIPLIIPEYNIQKQISKTLFDLDSKIELNNRINAELEAMAKTIYDYWFVQFDFPISAEKAASMGKPQLKGKPYKSSGGKMVWNEEVKRDIPDGWEVKLFSDWIENDKSGDWGKEQIEGNYSEKVYCIRGADINGLNGLGELKSPKRYILEKNLHKTLDPADLIIEISGGSPTQSTGRLAFITEDTLARFDAPIICSNFCKAVTLKNKTLLYNFVYHWKSIYDAGVLFGFEGKTSGIKNLLFESFVGSHYTVVPEDSATIKFFNFITQLESKKQKNLLENQKLTELRDWLLPMLMNGQVKVSER